MEVIFKDSLDDKLWKHVAEWNDVVFPTEGKGMEWAPLKRHVLAMENGLPAAHIGFDRFVVGDSGEKMNVVGIGAVVVRPEFQKKRIPALMFKKLHAQCPESIWAETFTLFCPERLIPYYQKHGYEKIDRPVENQQFGKPIITSFTFMARGDGIPKKGEKIVLFGPPW